jgi:hypothetical protein
MEPVIWVALIGIGGTLGASIISNVFTDRRETKRREHEQYLKRTELESNRQEQRREERIQAYRSLAKLTVITVTTEPFKSGDLAEAYAEIELVADSDKVKEAAYQLYLAASEARRKVGDTR